MGEECFFIPFRTTLDTFPFIFSLFSVWGARAPKMNSIEYGELKNMSVKFDVGDER